MKRKLCLTMAIIMVTFTACQKSDNTETVQTTVIETQEEMVTDVEAESTDEIAIADTEEEADTNEELTEDTTMADKVSPYLNDIDLDSFDVDADAFTYSSLEFAGLLKAGWNLGNTLDATSTNGLMSEIAWGQPFTTKEMIDFVAECEFTSIRIPVSWGLHTSGENYEIDPEWMDRVKTVVDWAMDNNLYVIINSHHDNDFYYPTKDHLDKSLYYIDCIWSQIADTFRDYDEHLIFEGMNEPRLKDTDLEWYFDKGNPQGLEALECISALNQRFIDTVRRSGGNNTLRYLMISAYAGNPDLTIDNGFEIATDPANHMLMSIHAYTPYDFAMNVNGYRNWDLAYNETEFVFMDKAKEYFIDKGIGVSITEMGATNKNNLQPRAMWYYYYTQKASELGISCFVWDNGNNGIGEECFAFIGRTSRKVLYPPLLEALVINYRDAEE